MGIVWKKVWRDVAHNKARTALAVLSTAVGILALGLVFGLSGVMRDQLTAVHREALPAHITFQGGPFSPCSKQYTVANIGLERTGVLRRRRRAVQPGHRGRRTARAGRVAYRR